MFFVSHSMFSVTHNMSKRKTVPVHQLLGFSHGLIFFFRFWCSSELATSAEAEGLQEVPGEWHLGCEPIQGGSVCMENCNLVPLFVADESSDDRNAFGSTDIKTKNWLNETCP